MAIICSEVGTEATCEKKKRDVVNHRIIDNSVQEKGNSEQLNSILRRTCLVQQGSVGVFRMTSLGVVHEVQIRPIT
jgi:hypothetical protein